MSADSFNNNHHEEEHQNQLTMAGLAYRRRWSALAFRAALHPEEIDQLSSLDASEPDRHHHRCDHHHQHDTSDTSTEGWTLLHWVCCNAPPIEMLQSLFRHESAKRAARMQDRNGMTPLLCACACQASLEIIALLLDAVPECIHIYDADGWTPLHYICSQVRGSGGSNGDDVLQHYHGDVVARQRWAYSVAAVQLFLQRNPSLALVEDCYKQNPIQLLCGLYEVELQSFYFRHGQPGQGVPLMVTPQQQQQQQYQQHQQPLDNNSLDRLTLELVRGLWPLLQVMIDAALSTDTILAQATILHKVVALPGVSVDLLIFALALHSPTLALEQDGEGNTPLHVALLQQQQQQYDPQVRYNRPLIHFLLLGQRQAAQVRNAQGMVPLQFMLDQPWNTIHAALLNAYPAAVETCGLNDEHYGHVLAQCSRCSSKCDPQTIYEILRARPNLVMASLK